jgi:membrane protease YdiL (CAAX protease family)
MRNAAISTGKIVLYFVLLGLFVAGLVEFGVPMLGLKLDAAASTSQPLILGVINLLAMSLPAMGLMALFDGKSPIAMGLTSKSSVADFLTGGVVGGFIFVAAVAAAFFGGWATFNPDFAKISVSAMAVSMLGLTLASAGEEVMMRGYVLQELMSKFSTPASVIVSSLIFTALHGGALIKSDMAAIGALNIFLASVLLSLAYLATRTLWLPIGIHAGWNIMQGPVLGFNVSGNDFGTGWHPVAVSGPDMVTGGIFGFEGSVLGLIGPTLGILMMLLMRKRTTSLSSRASE